MCRRCVWQKKDINKFYCGLSGFVIFESSCAIHQLQYPDASESLKKTEKGDPEVHFFCNFVLAPLRHIDNYQI